MNENQNNEIEQDVNHLMQIRREKLEELTNSGNNPFEITKFNRTHTSKEIRDNYDALEGQDVTIAGRIMAKRIMGKASFCTIQDSTGKMQSYVSTNDLGEEKYKQFKTYDVGDIIGITGFVFKTRTEEISVHAKEMTLLSKSLKPLPEKFHGLKDMDLRYRQRYVDLIVNPEVKDTFIKRSQIISEIRKFLDEKGYLEVETPILNTISGGATARPFITHHNTLDLNMYLRIATELNLKRLIVGGYDKVYEIGRIFRNEGMDIRHNPEFTSIELYSAYEDYQDMMNITEEIFKRCAERVCGTTKISYQGTEIDLGGAWKRVTMIDSIKEACGVDFNKIETDEEAIALAKEKGIEIPKGKETRGNIISLFFDEYVEEKLVQPTFIYDYPIEISPLAKKKKEDPRLVERFEAFIGGREYGNAFSELNDPIDQYERFKEEIRARENGDEEAGMMDEDYINALEIGLPPTGGLGIGIDRMIMLLTDSASIRDVLLFPTMKPLAKNNIKENVKVEKSIDLSKGISRQKALELLKKYNNEEFHIRHALTVEGVMRYFAKEQGEDIEYWGNIGLLHDVDFEQYPEEHCKKCIEILKNEGVGEEIINSICSHGYGICSDVEPSHIMEKILYATDELTGLIWATAKMRPSKSVQDLEVSSLKKKFKDKKFAAGCSREIITQGAEMLGWELDKLFEKTILAMRENETEINEFMQAKN